MLDAIQGPLDIVGGGVSDSLTINDNDNVSHTYTLTAAGLTRQAAVSIAPIDFSRMTTADLYEPTLADNISIVQGTAAGTAVTVHPGSGNDGLTVTTLDQVQGPLNFSWTGGTKSLVVSDTAAGAATYTLAPLELDRTGAARIQFDQPSVVELFPGQTAAETVDIPATVPGTQVSVFAGSGPDTVAVASGGEDLDAIAGPLSVLGGGNTTVRLEDQHATAGHPYSLSAGQFEVGVQPPIAFSGLTGLVLDSGPLGNQTSVTGTARGPP